VVAEPAVMHWGFRAAAQPVARARQRQGLQAPPVRAPGPYADSVAEAGTSLSLRFFQASENPHPIDAEEVPHSWARAAGGGVCHWRVTRGSVVAPTVGHFCLAPPNVRAEATREAWRPWAAQDNGACDCPARPKGGTPRGVASRARG
jgi:hypothetical protein